MSPCKNIGTLGEAALGVEISVCVIKQVDEFPSSDGFKRAVLKETFLLAKIIFLKLLGKWPLWSGQVFLGSELSGRLKRLCALTLV